jgi:hypothetical protein
MGTVGEDVIARGGLEGEGAGWRGVQISGIYSYRVQTDAMDDVGS